MCMWQVVSVAIRRFEQLSCLAVGYRWPGVQSVSAGIQGSPSLALHCTRAASDSSHSLQTNSQQPQQTGGPLASNQSTRKATTTLHAPQVYRVQSHTPKHTNSPDCVKAGLLVIGATHVPGIDLGAGIAEGWGPGAGNLAVGGAEIRSWLAPPL